MEYSEKYVKKLLPNRPNNSHKGTFGNVLNIAGSEFYTGAAYFSSIAALKVGCGKVSLSSAENVLKTVSALSPDLIFIPINKLEWKNINENYDVFSIGCGLSKTKNAQRIFNKFIKYSMQINKPIVIDADGLNILSTLVNIKLPINTILTPHPKELSRLLKVSLNEILSKPDFWIKQCCEKYNCTTILKLHKSLVADNKGAFYINNTGNSSLSHGGSGDILTGMISGLLAQGLNTFDASCLAVYLHGLAGELASKDLTEYSVLASNILSYIPKAIQNL